MSYLYNNIVALDLETTGFSKNKNQILEIGLASLKGDTLSILVGCKNIPKRITEITTIDKRTLVEEGCYSIKEGLEKFKKFCGPGRVLFVGHNIQAFDIPFLNHNLRAHRMAPINPNFCFDTILQMRSDLSKKRERTWLRTQSIAKTYRVKDKTNLKASLAYYKIKENKPFHRAVPDAKNSLNIFIKQVQLSKYPIKLYTDKQ